MNRNSGAATRATGAGALLAFGCSAGVQQAYPAKPIRVILPYAAGAPAGGDALRASPASAQWNPWSARSPSVLSQQFAAQKTPKSAPYIVGNPRQVSNLAAVSFASGTHFDTFAMPGPLEAAGDLATNL